MAQYRAMLVFCSSCKILYFASSVHLRIATEILTTQLTQLLPEGRVGKCHCVSDPTWGGLAVVPTTGCSFEASSTTL